MCAGSLKENQFRVEKFHGDLPGVGSTSLFHMMIDNAPDLMWAKDMDNKYLFANRAICDILLMCGSSEAVVGKDDLFFAARERKKGYLHTFGDLCINSDEVVKTTRKQGRFVEEGFVRGQYLILDVSKAPLFDDAGQMVGTVGSARDITAQRYVELELKENEARYKNLFNLITDAVFVHPFADKRFQNFVEVNDVACQWYGYSRRELLGMSPDDLMLKGDGQNLCCESHRRFLLKSGRWTSEALHKKKNNDIFPVELSSSMFEYHGKPMILSVVRDITDRRQSEKERADAVRFAAEQEKFAMVGQVAGKMAHDFNNILGGIMGITELTLLNCTDKQLRFNMDIILEQTLRGKNMTRDLVGFARDLEPKEEFFPINDKVELVLHLMKKDLERVQVVKAFTPGLPDLLADPGMIEHALVNLVQNAVHAMSKTPAPVLRISTGVAMKCLTIEIQDNGCGIPARFHDQIYSPSFTLKGSKDIFGRYDPSIEGTGYGMANVKKYILKHKGRIRFTSNEGEGTCFFISIPLVSKTLTRIEKRRMKEKRIITGRRILLVEDEPSISGVQQKILTQAPFFHEVVAAYDGQSAIEAFDRGKFDLVSLDYLLSGRLNGMDIYMHIRRTHPDIPVVFVSGNMAFIESVKEICAQDKMVAYLSKPCENIVYADTVNHWLSRI